MRRTGRSAGVQLLKPLGEQGVQAKADARPERYRDARTHRKTYADWKTAWLPRIGDAVLDEFDRHVGRHVSTPPPPNFWAVS